MYRKKHAIVHIGFGTLRFRASTGGLGTSPPKIRGDRCTDKKALVPFGSHVQAALTSKEQTSLPFLPHAPAASGHRPGPDEAGLRSGSHGTGTAPRGAHPPGAPPRPRRQSHLGSDREGRPWQSQTERPGRVRAVVSPGMSARAAGGEEERGDAVLPGPASQPAPRCGGVPSSLPAPPHTRVTPVSLTWPTRYTYTRPVSLFWGPRNMGAATSKTSVVPSRSVSSGQSSLPKYEPIWGVGRRGDPRGKGW